MRYRAMASLFRRMFAKGEGFVTYLVHVNNLSDVVVYVLGKDGKPTDMVSGDAAVTIGMALNHADPFAFVVELNRGYGSVDNPDAWQFYSSIGNSQWSEAVRILNGRTTS